MYTLLIISVMVIRRILLGLSRFQVVVLAVVSRDCLTSIQPSTDYVLHTREVMMHLELDKVNIIGHSMGTAIGVMLAGSFPESVNAMIW